MSKRNLGEKKGSEWVQELEENDIFGSKTPPLGSGGIQKLQQEDIHGSWTALGTVPLVSLEVLIRPETVPEAVFTRP